MSTARDRSHAATRRGPRSALLAAALLVVLAACSGGEQAAMSGDAEGGGAAMEAPDVASMDGGSDAREVAPPRQGSTAARVAAQGRAVIRTGRVSLVTREIPRARDRLDDLLARHGGYLASEDTVNDRAGRPERSRLVLRVPEPAFDTVMDELTTLGRTRSADRSSEDVTTEMIDVTTRVGTAEASLARLQRFLRQADRMEDIIRLESEIATRQAELESLKAQQRYLADQTSMSTITVSLRVPHAAPAPEPEEQGFLAGLAAGWQAFTGALVAVATLAGLLLPFLVALTILGVPGWLLLHGLRRRRGAPSEVEPSS
jgi:hypothetical protein